MSSPTGSVSAPAGRLRRRVLLVATLALGVLVLAAGAVYACTTYWGQTTIENIDNDHTGEFTVVADPTSAMDRCDDHTDNGDSDQEGEYDHPTKNLSDDDEVPHFPLNSGDTIRVGISQWEPNGEDSGGNSCGLDDGDFKDGDKDGEEEHSLANSTGDGDNDRVYVNTYDGDAYHDSDGGGDSDGVYEDDDCGLLSCSASNETNGDATNERTGDCMSDNENGPYPIDKSESSTRGQFKDTDNNSVDDVDNDDVNDVEINPSFGSANSTGHAAAVCVSESDAGDSAPQIPLEVT
jgi:hypothetical protein